MHTLQVRSAALALILMLLACSVAVPGAPTPTANTPIANTPLPTLTATPTALPPTKAPTASPQPSPTWAPSEHVIGVRTVDGVAEFYHRLSGDRWAPRGVNYVFVSVAEGRYTTELLKVGVYDPARTRADFTQLAGLGYNTVRVFLDHCGQGPGCIGAPDNNGLNPSYLDNLADMLAAAHEAGVFVLFASNDLPDQGGYSEEANSAAGDTFAGYRNAYYLTPAAVRATRRYWRDLLSGLRERRAAFDAVLGWELVNEQWMFIDQPPLSLGTGMVETTTGFFDMSDPEQKRRMVSEGLIYYSDQVRAEILTYDPTALVAMGFFVPELVAPGWYVDTAPLLAGAPLDFFDFHAYPGGPSLAEHAEKFGMLDYDAKPIIMGEYGAFRHRYAELADAAEAVTSWVAESCAYGFDGWLYWTYYPANAEVGDRTWSFTDAEGTLMALLAPANQADPCIAPAVPGSNLATGRPVQSSNALAPDVAEQAVDGNTETVWLAGGHPPQWIEVDLGDAYRVSEIRLLVSQSPAGPTQHRLLVRGPDGGPATLVHEFAADTSDGDWLEFVAEAPLENVRYVRVETVSSPSWVAWREIVVRGGP
jgi:preprotein translocase subunit Sec61beta